MCALTGALTLAPADRESQADGETKLGLGAFQRFGDLEILGEIARGGMGVVFKARQVSLNRTVAVKMILAGALATPEFIRRFREEAAAVASLQHPNIVAIYEIGEHDGQLYFSMEYIDGQNLAELTRDGPLPAVRAAELTAGIAAAVHYAHERGILHRDLKPSNVLLDCFGQPRVTDFGLAKRMADDAPAADPLTVTGQILGSPNYLPPEQASSNRGTVSRGSDVYSLGAILYHLITGRPPFSAGSVADTLAQVLNAEPAAPRLLNPSLPRDLETICLKCLEKEPARRYATAQEVAEELERFLKDKPILARPLNPVEKAVRWGRRNLVLASLAATIVFLLVLVAGGSSLAAWRIRKAQLSLAQNLYAADMKTVETALADGNYGRARALLESYEGKPNAGDFRSFEWGYFRAQARGGQLSSVLAHSNAIAALAFAPDGKILASAGLDGLIRLWQYPSLHPQKTFTISNAVFSSLSFSSDGRLLAAATRTDGVFVWDLESGQRTALPGFWLGLAFAPSGAALAMREGPDLLESHPGSIRIRDCATGREERFWPGGGSKPAGLNWMSAPVAWSADGHQLFVGFQNDGLAQLDVQVGRESHPFHGAGVVGPLACSPDGMLLATANDSTEVSLWKIKTGEGTHRLRGHSARLWSIAFSPDSRWLATASSDRTVRLWDVQTGVCRRTLLGHANEVWSVAFSPDGKTLASADKDGALLIWRVDDPGREENAPEIAELDGPRAFSPDGSSLAVSNGSNQVAVIDTLTGRVGRVLPGAGFALSYSSDGRSLRTFGPRGITRYGIPDFTVLETRPLSTNYGDPVYEEASPDGNRLALGYDDGRIALWSVEQAGLLDTTKPVVPESHGLVRKWREADGVTSLAFSPDGSRLAATWSRAQQATVYSGGLQKTMRLVGHTMDVYFVVFSPDGKTIATASVDDTVKLWDADSGRVLTTLTGAREGAYGLAFSPDNRTLAVICGDQRIKLWNLATRRETAGIRTEKPLKYLDFSPDGRTLVAFSPWPPDTRLQFIHSELPLALVGADKSKRTGGEKMERQSQ